MKILVVGGAGFIGGVTATILNEQAHDVTVFDNLSTGKRSNIPKLKLIEGDIASPTDIDKLFEQSFDVVMHFAAKMSVIESVHKPHDYFTNNVVGSMNLINASLKAGVRNIIFSSTCAVYGQPKTIPITEETICNPINPYGGSKYMTELMLEQYRLHSNLNWVALRYFNAVGGYAGIIQDYGYTTHLFPSILTAHKHNKPFKIYGQDYNTPDGTCVRDYVHVKDLAHAHIVAAQAMSKRKVFKQPINLGTGTGSSVKEVVGGFEKVLGCNINTNAEPRRSGDPAKLIADPSTARLVLGWQTTKNLTDMIQDSVVGTR